MPEAENRAAGLTVGRRLLLTAVLGLVLALLVPLYRRVSHVSALRRTIADMRVWQEAIAAYKADHGALPSNPRGEITFGKKIVRELRPYFARIRTADWWGCHYGIWLGPGIHEYGLESSSAEDVLIVSTGRRGVREAWRFDPDDPAAGFFDLDTIEDFEKDLVVWNGRPVRWPKDPR